MLAGKDVSGTLLVVALALCCGCQNSPPRRLPRPKPMAAAELPGDGTVRAAGPLRIAEPPAPPPAAEVPGAAPAPPPAGERPAVPASAPADPLPALPDPPSPGTTPPPAPAAAPAEGKLRRLHRLAAEEYARMDGYVVRLTRREQVNGKDQPKEVIKLCFRKDPWSIHFTWLEGDAKGREVVYVKGRYDNKLHTRLGPGDAVWPLKPGSRLALDPDNPKVRSSSRHGITEAGVGSLIARFGVLVEAAEKGDKTRGTLTYLGPQKRPEFDAAVEAAELVLPAGVDKDLPRGGRRLWMFDAAKHHLPVLIITTDDKGHEVEYYLHDRYIYPVTFDDRDFDPDKLWGKP